MKDIFMTVALVVLFNPASAVAQPLVEPGELIRQHADEVGVSDEVLEEIVAIGRDARVERDLLLAEVHRARAEVELLLGEDEPDVDAVMLALEVLGDAETALRQFDVAMIIEMRALLTPEQREAFADFFPPPGPGGRPPPPGGGPPPPSPGR